MIWRGLFKSRTLQTAKQSRLGHHYTPRQFSSIAQTLAQGEINQSIQSSSIGRPKQIPLARHADLLATSGTEDDVTGIELKIAGLVRSIRKQKKVAFAHISDGSTLQPVQAILTPELAKDITNGSYVELVGTWDSSPAKGQSNELQVTAVDRVGHTNPDDFPIQKKMMGADFLRTLPHLRFRSPLYGLITRARSHMLKHVNRYYSHVRLNEVYQVQPPTITSSDCEGAGEVFTITPKNSVTPQAMTSKPDQEENRLYFRDPKYLTVSSQLHLEAYSAELGDVWTLAPTFRAEESDTPRHLSEFYMLEAEFRSVTSLTKLIREVEDLVRYLVTSFRTDTIGNQFLAYYADPKYRSEDPDHPPANLEERWFKVDGSPWTTITYADAIAALESQTTANFNFPPSWQSGLQLEHERWLVEHVGNNSPLFVTDYPKHIKPFYMLPSNAASDVSLRRPATSHQSNVDVNAETVACFDLLFPFGTAEVTGGSLREHRLPNLISSMREKGLIKQSHPTNTGSITDSTASYPYLQPGESLGSMQWYADLRRFGSSPHGGFGLGFDRLLAYVTGVANVRDTVGFPRWFGRADC